MGAITCLPLAYFIYHYLKLSLRVDHPEVKCYESIRAEEGNMREHTNDEVEKLINSNEYKRYRDSRRSSLDEEEIRLETEEEKKKMEEIEEVIAELVEKERDIFDVDE